MKKYNYKIYILALCILFMLVQAYAHEYLLLAEDYTLQKGDTLNAHLFVSSGFNVEFERTLQKNITKSFDLYTPEKKINLLPSQQNEQIPVLNYVIDFEGEGLIGMQRDYARIALPPAQFAEYLKEDGLDNIQFDASKTTAPQREKYSRYIKTLILSGKNTNSDLYKKQIGYNLEIILLDNPYTLNAGDSLRVKILFKGQPLANKLIKARNRKGDENTISQEVKTNEKGETAIYLQRGGIWVIHLTHITACADKTDCEWESFWASYSFAIE